MPLALTHCFVTVHDQDEALRFYRDVLGLEVRADMAMGGMRWVTVAAPSQDVQIALETPDGRPGDIEELRRSMREGSLTGITLQVDDVDATFKAIVASRAPVVLEPTDQPYGVRDCAVRDPSGNMVRLSQPLRSEPS
jgi:catechol 2,3-dioxygenase-like lactoylglutathione lyase family enzyme